VHTVLRGYTVQQVWPVGSGRVAYDAEVAVDPDEVDETRRELADSSGALRQSARRLREVTDQLELLAAERDRLHAEYAGLMTRVWEAVRAADRDRMSVAEMVRVTGFPRHWLYRRVNSKVPPRVVGRVAELGEVTVDERPHHPG
jgi:predicted transcriptional regulator